MCVPCMRLSCVNQSYVLDCANSGRPTLLSLLPLLLLLLPMLTPVPVRGSVASGMRCLLNTPEMVIFFKKKFFLLTKFFLVSTKFYQILLSFTSSGTKSYQTPPPIFFVFFSEELGFLLVRIARVSGEIWGFFWQTHFKCRYFATNFTPTTFPWHLEFAIGTRESDKLCGPSSCGYGLPRFGVTP